MIRRTVIAGVIAALATLAAVPEVHRSSESPEFRAGFFCANHSPSHYARNSEDVQRYTSENECSGWTAVTLGNIRGTVAGPGGGIGGAQINMLAGDGLVVAGTISGPDGGFVLADVPTDGKYAVRAQVIGYQSIERVVDARLAVTEGVRLSLGGEGH